MEVGNRLGEQILCGWEVTWTVGNGGSDGAAGRLNTVDGLGVTTAQCEWTSWVMW